VSTVSKEKRVSDITVAELQEIIRDTVRNGIDSDYGLELRPEVEKELRESKRSKRRIPVEDVAKALELKR
jgi:hypothetical protein